MTWASGAFGQVGAGPVVANVGLIMSTHHANECIDVDNIALQSCIISRGYCLHHFIASNCTTLIAPQMSQMPSSIE